MTNTKKTVKKKPEVIKDPLPKEGTFVKYLFWFMNSHTKKFIGILTVLFVIIFFLTSDIGFYEDVQGNWKFTLSKKAMQFKTMSNKIIKKVKK